MYIVEITLQISINKQQRASCVINRSILALIKTFILNIPVYLEE